MQALINLANKNEIKSLDSKVYQSCGEACLEVNLFHEAVDALTKAISKNPENKQAYFFRAAAYFENGHFDNAIKDYLMSDQGKSISLGHKASKDFTIALINSTCQAASESIVDFVPSLCSSVYGLGTTIWAAHPLNPKALKNIDNFSDACYAAGECVVDYCKNVDKDTLSECVDQIKVLYKRFDKLNDKEKGELIGQVIGKYGVDIIATSLVGAGAGIAVAKGNQLLIKGNIAHKNLRNANRACTLETMASSKANKEIVTSSALKHAADREYYFKNIGYNFDAHNKHILEHNDYDSLRSIWSHPDPEGLLRKLGGKGHPERGIPGQPGFKETVDFGEYIGIWKSEEGAISLPTTRGTIHYGKKGAHIVPVHPNPKHKKLKK